MVTSVENLKKEIEKRLSKYPKEDLEIEGKSYPMYVFNENKSLNIFEGFLFKEISDKQKLKDLLNYRYSPGYTVRIGIYIYNGDLIIKDYLAKKQVRKTISKINKLFLKKFTKALEEPKEENISALFDRTDVIEEFYVLYRKSREFLLKKIKGIPEEEKRKEFVDNFMMQMLTLWYLQEKGFFNNDRKYLINTFKEYKNKGFQSFYEFLNYLFDKISGISDDQYVKDEKIGNCVVIGPAIFLNGEEHKKRKIEIPDECFYQEGLTEELINLSPRGSRRILRESDINFNIPLLNLFESRDWTEGNIDEFVLGAIFEKLMSYDERRQTGAYYTPEEITSYICENTIKPYLLDRINEKFKREFKSIEKAIEEGNQDILEFLFKQLQDIKILDPACGSGHFLEDAIEVLVDIYEKLWQKAKDLNFKGKFVIKTANEKGEIQDIDLVEISDEEKFKLFVKFFIILSRNIYGVDINPSAIKIARARLFLTLAKHFKKDKNLFIRFPNVHFNLREGNSLVGYLDLKKENSQKKFQLNLFSKKANTKIVKEKIDNLTEEEKKYIRRISEFLSLEGDIIRELQILNSILAKSNIDWEDFKKVAKTKEKLIKILVVSLNSIYARKLNEIIRKITELFNQKLNEKFSEEFDINLEDLKKVKTFHWIFEFPEVFLEKKGFDIVIGNPPYINIYNIPDDSKKIYSTIYVFAYKKYDIYVLFIERGLTLLNSYGYISYIVPDKWIAEDYGYKLREYFVNFKILKEIIDLRNLDIFKGVGVRNTIFICVKEKLFEETIIRDESFNIKNRIDYNIVKQHPKYHIRLGLSEKDIEIIEYLLSNSIPLKNVCYVNWGCRPSPFKEYVFDSYEECLKVTKNKNLCKRLIKGKNVKRYYHDWSGLWLAYSPTMYNPMFPELFENDRIVSNEVVGDGGISATIVNSGFYTDHSLNNIIPYNIVETFPDDVKKRRGISYSKNSVELAYNFNLKTILIQINSRVNYWFHKKYISNELNIYPEHIRNLRLKIINTRLYEILSDYLLFLNAKEVWREKYKNIINYLDKQITDSLIYELYFKEKFQEDGIYPELKGYLLEAVSEHLKPINYDRWVELYWKKQFKGNLSLEEEKEFEKLEKENLETIKEAYKSLKKAKNVQNWIEKIKSHEWVKIIEESIK